MWLWTLGSCFLICEMEIITLVLKLALWLVAMGGECILCVQSAVVCLDFYATRGNRSRIGPSQWACCKMAIIWGFCGFCWAHWHPIISNLLFEPLTPTLFFFLLVYLYVKTLRVFPWFKYNKHFGCLLYILKTKLEDGRACPLRAYPVCWGYGHCVHGRYSEWWGSSGKRR